MFVYRYLWPVTAFVYPKKETPKNFLSCLVLFCPDVFAVTNVQSCLLSVCFYRKRHTITSTFHLLSIILTHTSAEKAHTKLPIRSRCISGFLVSRNAGGSGAEAVFPLSWRKGTCSAERTVRSRAGEQTLPVKEVSVLLLARRLPTGCAGTKGNVRGVQIQSLVMQKSWDWLSGWQTNGGDLLILHQLCLIFTTHLNPQSGIWHIF